MKFKDTLAIRLRAAYMHLHRSANRHFRQFDATADQYAVLTCLAEAEDGITQQDVVETLASDKRTIGKMIDLLEEKGLVERREHPKDNRAWALFLTKKGCRRQTDLYDSADYLRRRLEEAIPPEHFELVLNALTQMAERLDPAEIADIIENKSKRKTTQ